MNRDKDTRYRRDGGVYSYIKRVLDLLLSLVALVLL